MVLLHIGPCAAIRVGTANFVGTLDRGAFGDHGRRADECIAGGTTALADITLVNAEVGQHDVATGWAGPFEEGAAVEALGVRAAALGVGAHFTRTEGRRVAAHITRLALVVRGALCHRGAAVIVTTHCRLALLAAALLEALPAGDGVTSALTAVSIITARSRAGDGGQIRSRDRRVWVHALVIGWAVASLATNSVGASAGGAMDRATVLLELKTHWAGPTSASGVAAVTVHTARRTLLGVEVGPLDPIGRAFECLAHAFRVHTCVRHTADAAIAWRIVTREITRDLSTGSRRAGVG